jgi:hypothetical protein
MAAKTSIMILWIVTIYGLVGITTAFEEYVVCILKVEKFNY